MEQITFTLEQITPDLAAEMLTRNVGNRRKSPTDIVNLSRDMSEGRFRLTHQAIAFDRSGNLIDGQHRLEAVVKSGATVWMYVARYQELTTAKALPLDIGRKRTAAQILQEDSRAVQVVSTAWRVTHNATEKTIPRHILAAAIETHSELIVDLISRCKANLDKTPVAVRAGMFLALAEAIAWEFPERLQHTLKQISVYVSSDYKQMCPAVQSLNRQRENGSWSGAATDTYSEQYERAARAYIAFDENRRNIKTIRVSNPNEELRSALAMIGADFLFPVEAFKYTYQQNK